MRSIVRKARGPKREPLRFVTPRSIGNAEKRHIEPFEVGRAPIQSCATAPAEKWGSRNRGSCAVRSERKCARRSCGTRVMNDAAIGIAIFGAQLVERELRHLGFPPRREFLSRQRSDRLANLPASLALVNTAAPPYAHPARPLRARLAHEGCDDLSLGLDDTGARPVPRSVPRFSGEGARPSRRELAQAEDGRSRRLASARRDGRALAERAGNLWRHRRELRL